MGNPGGFNPRGEDWIGRELAELRAELRELKAANVFGTTGITPKDGGTDFDGYVNINGPAKISGALDVTGAANFTGDTTIGGDANITGNITKSNGWGSASLGDTATIGTPGAGSPSVSFTRNGTSFGQSVGIGLKDSSGLSTLTVNGPHVSDPAYLQLSSARTFSLAGDSTSGPQISSTAGGAGTATIFGGRSNGSVNLNAYGAGNIQCNGKTVIAGDFSVSGTKAFIMDHPVHPDTMNLMHAATESPVNGVEYWGSATLDATGQATATLPSYFEALTSKAGRNIQLTPIGRTTVQVSATHIVDGSFVIYGAPGQEVDWLVKAERQRIVDGYDELSFRVEQDKPLIGPHLPETTR